MVASTQGQLGPDSAHNSQEEITEEIQASHRDYAQSVGAGGSVEHFPRVDFEPYRSSIYRHPTKDLVMTDPGDHRAALTGVWSH